MESSTIRQRCRGARERKVHRLVLSRFAPPPQRAKIGPAGDPGPAPFARADNERDITLELVSKGLLKVQKADPRGLKPAFWAVLGGTAEAVPFPKPILETSSSHSGASLPFPPRSPPLS